MQKAIRTENLKVSYDENLIIENLSLELYSNKITSIIGANGCGKSTILKSIGRILKPSGGMVLLDGKDIDSLSTKDIAKKMAILPQSPVAPNGILVKELVAYGRFPYQSGFGNTTKKDKDIIDWALEETKLIEFKNREIDELSGGQRQRAWIAMALAQQTDIILLDEPTTYLDLSHQLEVLELLEKLNKDEKRTIIMVLHDINLASRFSDYIMAINSGKIIKYGSPNEIMKSDVLRDTFNIEAHIIREDKSRQLVCVTYDLL